MDMNIYSPDAGVNTTASETVFAKNTTTDTIAIPYILALDVAIIITQNQTKK